MRPVSSSTAMRKGPPARIPAMSIGTTVKSATIRGAPTVTTRNILLRTRCTYSRLRTARNLFIRTPDLLYEDVVQGRLDQLELRHARARRDEPAQDILRVCAGREQRLKLVRVPSDSGDERSVFEHAFAPALEAQRDGVPAEAALDLAYAAVEDFARAVDEADVVADAL